MHYVIGDVHGYFDELMELFRQIEARDPQAEYVITGDLVDRGPKVMETVYWAMEHIKPGGTYQCVMGNHEDMLLKWYDRQYLPWLETNQVECPEVPLPRTRYDFSDQLIRHDLVDREHVEQFMKFFSSLPLTLSVTVTAQNGKEQEYKIAHGWYPKDRLADLLDPEELRHFIIWERKAIGRGNAEDYIIVHGHTPTVERECEEAYYLSCDPEPINPGLIAYRRHAINVDAGRPYLEEQQRFCTLCAICLETLEEFFADPLPEEYPYYENKYQKQMKVKLTE